MPPNDTILPEMQRRIRGEVDRMTDAQRVEELERIKQRADVGPHGAPRSPYNMESGEVLDEMRKLRTRRAGFFAQGGKVKPGYNYRKRMR